ncbi:MAG: hypothetical protein WAU89_23470 [Candidatus Acidiferrales bacterium]
MIQLVWLDLCSGLGGASQPALDRGWRVIRVDIDPRFKPDIVADVRDPLPLRELRPTVLWASSVCTDFSKWGLRCFFPNPPEPDLSIAKGCYSANEQMKPDYWFHENVLAARPFLNPIFGPPRIVTTGHVLWTNFGLLLPNIKPHKGAIRTGLIYKGKKPGWGPMNHGKSRGDSHQRAAKIPYEIGEAICAAVERRVEEAA